MAQMNVKPQPIYTHEGGKAVRINSELELRRAVMSCMLWESSFYESGVDIATRISNLIPQVKPEIVAEIAIEAREKMKLRHVPLLVVREMARLNTHKHLVASTLERVIQRPDEINEFVSIYWKEKKQPLSNQVKLGLGNAFKKFNEYSLAKYNQLDKAIKLRDILFLTHPKPKDSEQTDLWKRLVDNQLAVPDTWETALSASKGEDKKTVWERLLKENKLGILALLRNLRNCSQAGVEEDLIFNALNTVNVEKALPFRFIAAAKYAPQWEHKIEPAMLKCIEGHEKLSGKNVILIDVSGSMDEKLSGKSEMTRLEAACGLAILMRGICDDVKIFTFSTDVKVVPPCQGFALRDAIVNSQLHGGTYLGQAVAEINNNDYDRLIVITDEQSADRVPMPKNKAYMLNVASYKNGVGYNNNWIHLDGFSEALIDYIQVSEKLEEK